MILFISVYHANLRQGGQNGQGYLPQNSGDIYHGLKKNPDERISWIWRNDS